MDTDGFSLEEEEGSEVEELEDRQRSEGDQDSTDKQVISLNMLTIDYWSQ